LGSARFGLIPRRFERDSLSFAAPVLFETARPVAVCGHCLFFDLPPHVAVDVK